MRNKLGYQGDLRPGERSQRETCATYQKRSVKNEDHKKGEMVVQLIRGHVAMAYSLHQVVPRGRGERRLYKQGHMYIPCLSGLALLISLEA